MKRLTETLSILEMDYDNDSDYDPLPRMNNSDGENQQPEPGMSVICLANLTNPIGASRSVSNLWIVLKFSYRRHNW